MITLHAMDKITPNCPVCGHGDVHFLVKRQEYLCQDCCHHWSLLTWPAGIEPNTLPTYLAVPLASLLAEPHPRLRLHWLIDCAEIAVRWSVAVVLAQVLQADPGTGTSRLPETIAARIREHIERPTLGRWLHILAALSAARPTGSILAPAVFELHEQVFTPLFLRETQGGTLETSFLILRNRLAHGAGVGAVLARTLLGAHEPRIIALLNAVAQATAGIQVIAICGDHTERLAGPHPEPIPRPALLHDCADGPWLVGETNALPLLPLAGFEPVCRIDGQGRLIEKSAGPVIQLYQRAESERLTYEPFGSDEGESLSFRLDEFRALFRLNNAPDLSIRQVGEPDWTFFLRQARIIQEDMVGRAAERGVLKAWLKERDPRQPEVTRIGLVLGGPGVGKSLLMARLAADLSNAKPEHLGLYYYQFHAGDAGNSPHAFLSGLLAALSAWLQLIDPTIGRQTMVGTDQNILDAVRRQLAKVEAFPPPNPEARRPRFLVMADGLDELLPVDPLFPQQMQSLALPGTIWLLASRPEPTVVASFTGHGCASIFPDGFPPMSATDIRAMLYEGLSNIRHALIGRDQDTADADGVRNPFVDRVVACADGLPLYVHLLLDDLRHGQLTVWDEHRLPRGLVAYYDELMNRIGLSDLRRDLPLLVACLARAEEPMDLDSIALLLADVPTEAPRYHDRVRNATRAGEALLRRVPIDHDATGLTLYHQSFRDYVGGRAASDLEPATPPAAALRGTVRDAEVKLCRLALGWAELPHGHLRNHLLRWGVRYEMCWQRAEGLETARKRLTDFSFLQAFTMALPVSAIRDLVNDYETLLGHLNDGPLRQEFRLWEAFFRENEHILRRGDERWPTHKILLQLAVEHGDDSPVTQAAEAWLAAGQCDWVWLRNPRRARHAIPSPRLRTLEGHSDQVKGALELPNGRILSWSDDQTLRLWDGHHAAQIAIPDHQDDEIMGFGSFPDGRIMCWSTYHLYIWDGQNGDLLFVLNAKHSDGIDGGAQSLPDGHILSWSLDGTICLWDSNNHNMHPFLCDHHAVIDGLIPLLDGTFLFWSDDLSLYTWDKHSESPSACFTGHTQYIRGALELSDGRILSWSEDHTLRLWDRQTAKQLAVLTGHTDWVTGAISLSDGRILSWSDDHSLRLWDGQTGNPLALLTGHSYGVNGALILPDGRILSWSDDHSLRLWDGQSGLPLAILTGHSKSVESVLILPEMRILSRSYNGTLLLWDSLSGSLLTTLSERTGAVDGTLLLRNGHLLTWAGKKLEIWDLPSLEQVLSEDRDNPQSNGRMPIRDEHYTAGPKSESSPIEDEESDPAHWHIESVEGSKVLSDDRILAWLADGTLMLRNGRTGEMVTTLIGHSDRIGGVLPLPEERILTWSDDGTLRLWDIRNGSLLMTLFGHSDPVKGTRLLPDGRFISWTDNTLRLWDGRHYTLLATLSGPTDSIQSVLPLPEGRLLLRSANGSQLYLGEQEAAEHENHPPQTAKTEADSQLSGNTPLTWLQGDCIPLREPFDQVTGRELVRHCQRSHKRSVLGAMQLPDGKILGWYRGGKLHLWDGQSGVHLASLVGHTKQVEGAMCLPDGRILSWSADCTLRLWHWQKVPPLATLAGHTGPVLGALLLSDGRILSWSTDLTLRLWDENSGIPLATLAGHTREIGGARQLRNGNILSWSLDGTLRVWDQHSGAELATLVGGSSKVIGALKLSNGRLASWGDDETLRIWDGQCGAALSTLDGQFVSRQSGGQFPELANHIRALVDIQLLHDEGLLLRADYDSHTHLYLWRGDSASSVHELHHFLGRLAGLQVLPDGRIIAWSPNGELQWWNLTRHPFGGHILQQNLPWENTELLFLRNQFLNPASVSGQIVGWSLSYMSGIANCTGRTTPVCWHSGSEVHVHRVSRDGIVELGKEEGVDYLALYHGARRITMEEYEKNLLT